jgi:23S rRNA pseudouridine2605 synthase
MRLQRYLAQCGIAARRKAEALIEAGRVQVNGRRVTELGAKVDPQRDRVSVDGQAAVAQEPFYVLLNKPKGCITAVSDPAGRPTVMDYLPGLPVKVAPVGRLDFYTEGVLLLTNDGALSAALQSPRTHVEKTYHVKVRDKLEPAQLEALRDGVRLDDGTITRPAQVDVLSSKGRHEWLVITLTEGKSRQIHRMLEALGHTVDKLQRVAFGGITFHGLRVGDARELTQAEVNALRRQVGLAPSTTSRGAWAVEREETDVTRREKRRARVEGEAPTPQATDSRKATRRPAPAGARGSAVRRPATAATPRTGRGRKRPAATAVREAPRGRDRTANGRAAGPRTAGGERGGRGGERGGRGGARSGRGGVRSGDSGGDDRRRGGERGRGRVRGR